MDEIFTAPWYPWYADDILLSERVELMNLAEEGAYRRALDRAWIKGSIPADPRRCARMIGKGCSAKIAEVVLRMFRPSDSDPSRMINDTLEKIREEQRQKYLRQSKKGKVGADQRWHGHSTGNGTGNAQAMPRQWHSESDTEEEIKQEKKEETRKAASPSPKGTRIPEPFLLTKEMQEYGRTKRPHLDLAEETEKFVNYWRAKTGRDATKLDWLATWQNWILNTRGSNGSNKNSFTKRTDAEVLAESADFYENYPS